MGSLKNIFKVFLVLQICGNVSCIQTYYMNNKCGDTIFISLSEQVRVKSTSYGDYDSDMDCIVRISGSDKIMIYFNDISIEDSTDCSKDYLTIYDGAIYSSYLPFPSKIGKPKFCGYSTPSTVYESSGDFITLSFHSNGRVQKKGFDIVVTQFHEGSCYSWETTCSNGKCIDDSLACNGNNPCGDESDCIPRHIAIIIGATVGGVALVAVAISVGVCIYCARRRSVGRAGYMANGTPMATTTTSANMTTNFGSPYGPPPAYNQTNYGMGVVGQPQSQQPYPVTTATTTTQQYP